MHLNKSSAPLLSNAQYKQIPTPKNNNIITSHEQLFNIQRANSSSSSTTKRPRLSKPQLHGHTESSTKKLIAVVALFIISLVAFVSQTELTAYLYNSLDFDQPYFLLMMTHGSWSLIWPIQVMSIAIFKHFKKSRKRGLSPLNWRALKKNAYESIKNQHKNIYKTSGIIIDEHYINSLDYPKTVKEFIFSKSILNVIKSLALITTILTVAGVTWYIAMALTPASDVTAIYNCSAFSALVFAIPILKEKFTYLKLSSVLLAIIGVFFVAYSGDNESSNVDFPDRVWGDLIIAVGAVLYGLYEVLYKKMVCPSSDSVSSRRQVAFSNFCASIIGVTTLLTVWVLIAFVHVTGISRFQLIRSPYTWLIMILSLVSNLIFSLSFLSLMSLTSPVLSSVSSLVTILIVGLFEWFAFGIKLSAQQLIGDLFVVVGFVVLSYSYWDEITEEDVDDDSEYDPTDTEPSDTYQESV